MAHTSKGNDVDAITDINVTPLVDVVLVLLVILMVTASYAVSKSIPVDLPNGATGTDVPRTLSVSIDSEGRLFLDAVAVDETALRSKIRSVRQADPATRAVIAADGSSRHRDVVRVIDLLRQERVSRFAINVRPEDSSAAR